jgi:biopolymer transport protein ExbD
MRVPTQYRPDGEQLMMAPLIDVVFLLLIFFLCTATLQVLEGVLPANLPAPGSPPRQPTPKQQDLGLVRLRLTQLEGRVRIQLNKSVCKDAAELRAKLGQLARLGDPPVVIDSDQAVMFGDVIMVYDTCKDVGLKRIAFAAPREP